MKLISQRNSIDFYQAKGRIVAIKGDTIISIQKQADTAYVISDSGSLFNMLSKQKSLPEKVAELKAECGARSTNAAIWHLTKSNASKHVIQPFELIIDLCQKELLFKLINELFTVERDFSC